MKRIILLFAIMAFAGWANATTYLVQPGGSGATWSGVTGTVVDLTNVSKSLNVWYNTTSFIAGDQIWIIKGTYTLTDTIATKTTEKIYGGFVGTEQTVANRIKGTNSWDFNNETIIDGNALVRGIVSNTGATIDGLSIQNCMYSGVILNTGSAAKISNSSIIQNCIVRNNTTTGTNSAGGVYLTTNAKLLNSYIHHNSNTTTTQNGGGVFINNVGRVDGCTITYNTAGNSGGGIHIQGNAGGTVVNNSIISNNQSVNQSGGGINTSNTTLFTSGSVTISNCTISSNVSKINGGGMYIDAPGTTNYNIGAVNISNCIISINITSGNGAGVWLYRGKFIVNGCTINNNVSNAARSDLNGGGGIFVYNTIGGTFTLSNSIVKANNTALGTNHGSAIYTNIPSTFINCLITGNVGATYNCQSNGIVGTYQNCTFSSNLMSNGTSDAYMYLGAGVTAISTFTNCLFYKGTINPIFYTTSTAKDPVVTYCGFDLGAVPAAYANKTGCITGLTSASFSDATNGDWSLSPTSAAVDAGTTIAAVITDLTGTPRPQGTSYDMGTFESLYVISSFTPANAGNGIPVVITGANFTNASAVSFGGTTATSFTVNSASQITATVGSGTSGSVSVTTPGGTATKTGFTWVAAPAISSFTPVSAGNGTSVVITGTNLTGASAVSFGGTAASSFTVNSATQITATVGSGTTGSVSVITAGGTGTLTGFIWFEAPQIVSSVQNSSDLGLTSGSIVNVVNGGELTINSNTVVNSISVERGGKVTLNNTQSLTINGDFNINSDATGTGTFVDLNAVGGLSVNGTANVQQYLTGKTGSSTRAYWYLSSPVSAATSGEFNVAGGINKLTYYDETVPGFAPQFSMNTTTLIKGVGYVTYIGGTDAIYTFSTNTGTATTKLNTGAITLTPTRTGTSAAKRGFNLIGNPYPSFLDWNAVTKTNMTPTIWYRTYTGSVMQFDTFDGTNGTGLGANGLVSQYIPPMQAFWVKVTADGLTGSLVFNNTMRSHQDQSLSNNRLRAPSIIKPQVLRLKVSNGVNSDETLVVTNSNATDEFDNYDSPKMTNDNMDIPEIFTLAGDEEIVINNLNSIGVNKELALGFRTGAINAFTIKATQVDNFDTDTKIILKDNLLNSEQDITDGTDYSFTSDVVDNSSRFSILFKSTSVTTGDDTSENTNLKMYIYKNENNQIIINQNGTTGKEGTVTVCNAIGQMLVRTSTTGTITVIKNSFDSGFYFITVNAGGKNCTKKIIIN